MGVLVIETAGETRVFSERFIIGQRGDLVIADEYMSSRHVVLYPDGGNWYADDLGSMNGTWLNGQRIWLHAAIARGDRLKAGHTTMTLVPA